MHGAMDCRQTSWQQHGWRHKHAAMLLKQRNGTAPRSSLAPRHGPPRLLLRQKLQSTQRSCSGVRWSLRRASWQQHTSRVAR